MEGVPKFLKIARARLKDKRLHTNVKRFARNYANGSRREREIELRVEVIIPCFNHGAYVEEALASVPEEVPVVVVNDKSTDDTAEILSRLYGARRFRLIANEVNLNQAGSINRAVASSPANCFVVLNADDILTPGWIRYVTTFLGNDNSVRLAGGSSIPFRGDEGRRELEERFNRSEANQIWRVYSPADALDYRHPNSLNMTMSGCTFLRSAWEAVEGLWPFRNRVCSSDDRDFQMRVSALFPVGVTNHVSAFYRISSSSGKGTE